MLDYTVAISGLKNRVIIAILPTHSIYGMNEKCMVIEDIRITRMDFKPLVSSTHQYMTIEFPLKKKRSRDEVVEFAKKIVEIVDDALSKKLVKIWKNLFIGDKMFVTHQEDVMTNTRLKIDEIGGKMKKLENEIDAFNDQIRLIVEKKQCIDVETIVMSMSTRLRRSLIFDELTAYEKEKNILVKLLSYQSSVAYLYELRNANPNYCMDNRDYQKCYQENFVKFKKLVNDFDSQ